MPSPPWVDSVVRLASSDSSNPRFGTGFVVGRDLLSTHILTCAHVVTAVGGPSAVLIDGHRGRVVASGEGLDVDLAIIRVDARLDREPLRIEAGGREGMAIQTAGFEHVVGQDYVIRDLSGELSRQIGLESRSRTSRLEAWDIQVTDRFALQPGHSGSPIVDRRTGAVVGVLRIKHGDGERGLAISARVVQELWPDFPGLLTDGNEQEQQYVDWGFAPDVSCLFGRADDVATLRSWILKDHCRLIGIIGLRGIGKSSLTVALSRGACLRTDLPPELNTGLRDSFDFVFFRSLLNAPPASEILRDLIALISRQQEVSLSSSWDEQLARLVSYLQNNRCLVILDNVEAVLESGEKLAGAYRDGYADYEQLITLMGSTGHRSCLLLNSREKPSNLVAMEGRNRPVRTLQITGVDDNSGRMILDDIGDFTGAEADWSDVLRTYRGNPLALELVGKHIAEVFFGDISEFVRSGRPLFSDLQELLDWHLNRLSDPEIEVMYWLAVEREPVTLQELNGNLLDRGARQHLTSTVQALQRRIPLEHTASRFSLQPVLIEHITARLINGAVDDLLNGTWHVLARYCLAKALARDYVREAQVRLVATPVLDNLEAVLGGREAVQAHLAQYLTKLRHDGPHGPSYAAGNLLNLLCALSGTLEAYNFSGLDIRQANLQEVSLHGVNLAGANIHNCTFTQTFGPISGLALSRDGEMIAASESSGAIHIWRLADLQLVRTLRKHLSWILGLAFSPDGKLLASGGEDKMVRLWDLQTGECIKEFSEHLNSVWAVAFSPDGGLLATGSEDQTVKIWDLQTESCVATMADHDLKVFCLEFSPDGTRLASTSADHTVKVWDVGQWSDPRTLAGHTDAVRGAAFSPDSNLLATCGWDKTIRLWNVETGEPVTVLTGHTNSVHWVVFHPGGEMLASSSESGDVRIWNVREAKCVTLIQRHSNLVGKIAFSGDGQTMVSAGWDGQIRIWDTRDWVCRNTMHGYIDWVQAVAISPDGETVIGSNGDLTVRVWDIRSGQCRKILKGHTEWTFALCLSADGSRMATGSDDRTIRIWDTGTWLTERSFQAHSTWVQALAFSEDGSVLASASDDRTIKLWDVASGKCLRTLSGHADGVWSVAFAPDGPTLASGSEDYTIKLWNTEDGACLADLAGHEDRIHSVAFNSLGDRLVSSSDDRTVRVWDVRSGECLLTLRGHESWVIAAAFDATGRHIWSGGKDMTLRVWDAETGECLSVLEGHKGGISGLSNNGRPGIVATGSEDGSIRLWDATSHHMIKVLRPLKPYEKTNITGVSGLTGAQKVSLRALGAVSEDTEKGV